MHGATISLRQIRCRTNLVRHQAWHFDVLHHAFLYLDVTVSVSLWKQVHVDWALALGGRLSVAECRHRMGSSGLFVSARHVLLECIERLTGPRWQHDVEAR